MRREVEGSKHAIEQRLSIPVQHFCYPNGREPDYDATSIAAVRQAGFLSATTARRGLNGREVSQWELRRIGVDPFLSQDAFELELAGFRLR